MAHGEEVGSGWSGKAKTRNCVKAGVIGLIKGLLSIVLAFQAMLEWEILVSMLSLISHSMNRSDRYPLRPRLMKYVLVTMSAHSLC